MEPQSRPNDASAPAERPKKISKIADGKRWICLCVPLSEREKEAGSDGDEEEDEEEYEDNSQARCDDGETCTCNKPAEDYPQHQWVVTKKGYEMALEWVEQREKRCQDNFDLYIFNRYNGYGISEVIENMLLAFAKEDKKKRIDPMAMWSVIESMALFLRGDLFHWHSEHYESYDSEGN